MRKLQDQKNETLRMKLRNEVDAKTFRDVTAEIDAAHDQLAREHNRLASEAAMPELPDPSLAWEDLSAEDRRALTEILVDKIIIAPRPHKIVDGRRQYTIRAIRTKIPRWRPSGSRRCTRLGSRSSQGSECTINRFPSSRARRCLEFFLRRRRDDVSPVLMSNGVSIETTEPAAAADLELRVSVKAQLREPVVSTCQR